MSCHKYAFDMLYEDGSIREHNALKQLMHEHNNHQELVAYQQGNLCQP